MKNKTINKTGGLKINKTYEADPLEIKLAKIMTQNEPIETTTAPPIYTERKDGVLPDYDIRTDRFDIAIEMVDKATRAHRASRMAKIEDMKQEKKPETGVNTATSGITE